MLFFSICPSLSRPVVDVQDCNRSVSLAYMPPDRIGFILELSHERFKSDESQMRRNVHSGFCY